MTLVGPMTNWIFYSVNLRDFARFYVILPDFENGLKLPVFRGNHPGGVVGHR